MAKKISDKPKVIDPKVVYGKNDIYDVSTLEIVSIKPRKITCKVCKKEFTDKDVTCYDFTPERVLVACPNPDCGCQNIIKKELTIHANTAGYQTF